mgnify:CR=1 FL=1
MSINISSRCHSRQDRCCAQYIGHRNMQDTYHTENLHQTNGHQFPFKRKTSLGIFHISLLCIITLVPSGLGVPSQTTTGSTAMPLHWEMNTPIDMAKCINPWRWSWAYPTSTSQTLDLLHSHKLCLMIANESVQSKPTESSTTKTRLSLPTGNTEISHTGGTNLQQIMRTG